MAAKKELIQLDATLTAVLDVSAFTAELGNGCQIVAFVGRDYPSEMEPPRSGDRVLVELSPFDMGKGRILELKAQGK